MQMTDEVRRALQTLRDNATNDFERHRIDVLERDLTNPPRVEVVDDTHQRFDGVLFRKRTVGHYFTPNLSIHRAVWSYYHGELPEGYVIHHVDHCKDNNDASNLLAMTNTEHVQHHGNIIQAQTKAARRAKLLAKPYSGSGVRECLICGNPYFHDAHNGHRQTCSAECEQKLRDKNRPRVDRSRICEVCGKPFQYKHKCQKTCSPECGKILSGRTIKGRKIVERVISKCELCGKEIVHLPCEHPRFCSQNCLLKYMNQRRHKK